MVHEARTDYAMLLGCLFFLIIGAGRWSLDARLAATADTLREMFSVLQMAFS
jgi:hypothetical protein